MLTIPVNADRYAWASRAVTLTTSEKAYVFRRPMEGRNVTLSCVTMTLCGGFKKRATITRTMNQRQPASICVNLNASRTQNKRQSSMTLPGSTSLLNTVTSGSCGFGPSATTTLYFGIRGTVRWNSFAEAPEAALIEAVSDGPR